MDLPELLGASRRIVFFTGAGASTEPPTSIPDFRSAAGLWQDGALMEALTRGTFFRDPEGFWEVFRATFLPWKDRAPNAVHLAPARLAALGHEVGVVTQNIDGLDRRCSQGWPVYELHGHLRTTTCPACATVVPTEQLEPQGAPRCGCGAVLKPDVVLFDDALDFENVVLPAQQLLGKADLLVVVGTSLTVAPANLLAIEPMRTGPAVLINRDPTPWDELARLVLHRPAGEVLGRALDVLEGRPGATEAWRRFADG
jgi:NAD-dependent deacetylase